MSLTYRTTDMARWGAGKGSNLTATEVDRNFWDLLALVEALPDIPDLVEISNITTSANGGRITIHLSDGSTRGPFVLPVAQLRFRGAWAAATTYTKNDLVKVTGQVDPDEDGLYYIAVTHTSAATFDPTRVVSGIVAYRLWVPLVAGADGEDGTSFTPDAIGPFSDRDLYDGEADGFGFLSTDGDEGAGQPAVLYFRTGTVGGWTDAVTFEGPPGDNGADGADGADGEKGDPGEGVPEIDTAAEDKWLHVVDGFVVWDYLPSGSLPDIETGDEGRWLHVVGGFAVWDDLPNDLPEIDTAAEGRWLHVVDGVAVWDDLPTDDLLPEIGSGEETYVLSVYGGAAAWRPRDSRLPLKTITGATHTLNATDANYRIRFTNAAGCSIICPPGIFASTDEIFVRGTLGQLTFEEGTGMTINTPETLLTRKAMSDAMLIFVSTNEADLTGDLELEGTT
jgi:hypothetical protein